MKQPFRFFLTNNLALTKYDPNSDLFNGYFQRNDDIGWFAKEGIYTAGKLSASGHEVIYNVKYRIGQDGFRLTPSISKEKAAAYPDDLLRINFFGCSFMFGEGLNDDETIPFFVGKHLDSTHVKNFGFHGYGIHNALAIMQSNFNTNGSINVLLTAPWHATRSACKERSTFGSPKYVFDGDKVTKNGICGDASNSLMSEILSRSNIYKIIAPIRSTAVNKDFELYLRLVEEMFEKSRSNNQTFLVAFIKVEKDYFARSDYTNEMIFSALSKTSDAIIDVTLANTAEDIDPSLYIHSLDRHPSAKANAERANAIIELLKLKNIIP